MSVVFIHTADWQLGKPFAGVADDAKRALLQNERIEAIHRIGTVARESKAEFLIISGDLFDSVTPTKATVSAACSAIRGIGVPVFAIPGNHDHGGAGSVWRQEFFTREQQQIAPNFRILLEAEPVELPNAVLFPCPLLRRHETQDLLTWLCDFPDLDARFGAKPRIVIAHGSVLSFGAAYDGEDEEGGNVNFVDVTKLPEREFDYIALGDWHGAKQVASKAWYPGTPEPDRFGKGADYQSGHVLRVRAERGGTPVVDRVETGRMTWEEMTFEFGADDDLPRLVAQVDGAMEGQANRGLLRLRLAGALGIEASAHLERHLETWRSRLIRLKLDQQVAIAPSEVELASLTARTSDPLISRVAARLSSASVSNGPDADAARVALRELYLACLANGQ